MVQPRRSSDSASSGAALTQTGARRSAWRMARALVCAPAASAPQTWHQARFSGVRPRACDLGAVRNRHDPQATQVQVWTTVAGFSRDTSGSVTASQLWASYRWLIPQVVCFGKQVGLLSPLRAIDQAAGLSSHAATRAADARRACKFPSEMCAYLPAEQWLSTAPNFSCFRSK